MINSKFDVGLIIVDRGIRVEAAIINKEVLQSEICFID